nr:proteasome subunit beta type-6 [Paratrimastix eleionoma]
MATLFPFTEAQTNHDVGPAEQFLNEIAKKGDVDMGTSIMASTFNGGVILGADSRTSTGSYIANRLSDKITKLVSNIYVCRSGSSADTQTISDYVRYFLDSHSIEIDEQPLVQTGAQLLRNLSYDHRDDLSTSFICAGVDKTGPHIFSIPLGAPIVEQPFAIGGSGSTYIYGYCDRHFKENMSKEECVEFITQGLSLAMSRDGSSGGIIRLCILTNDGKVERRVISHHDIPKFFDKM